MNIKKPSQFAVGACLVALSLVTILILLANDIENGPTLIKTSRRGVFIYGIVLTATFAFLLTYFVSINEHARALRQLRENRSANEMKAKAVYIRRPMHFRSITLEEFRKMYGPDYPETWKREEG